LEAKEQKAEGSKLKGKYKGDCEAVNQLIKPINPSALSVFSVVKFKNSNGD
jgi:hypothetical protein